MAGMQVAAFGEDEDWAIAYTSRWVAEYSDEEMKFQVDTWARSNRLHGIRSFLVTTKKIIFQTLEGPKSSVQRIFHQIQSDGRHEEVAVIVNGPRDPKHSLGLTYHRVEDTEYIRAIHTLLEVLGVQYSVLWKFSSPIIKELMHTGMDPTQAPPSTHKQIVIAFQLLSFNAAMERMTGKNPMQAAEELTRLVNLFTNSVLQAAAINGGQSWGMRDATLYVTFPEEATSSALTCACSAIKRCNGIRSVAKPIAIDNVLYAAAGLVTATSTLSHVPSQPGHAHTNYSLLGGGVTLANSAVKYTSQLGYGIVLTGDVFDLVEEQQRADMRPLGAHILGHGLNNTWNDHTKLQTRFYTPNDKDPCTLDPNFLASVSDFYEKRTQTEKKLYANGGYKSPGKDKGLSPVSTAMVHAYPLPSPKYKRFDNMDLGLPEKGPTIEERKAIEQEAKLESFKRAQERMLEGPHNERPSYAAHETSQHLPVCDNEIERLFRKLDVNQNGWISREELVDFYSEFDVIEGDSISAVNSDIDKVVSQYGFLGDGRITLDEFAILMLKLSQK